MKILLSKAVEQSAFGEKAPQQGLRGPCCLQTVQLGIYFWAAASWARAADFLSRHILWSPTL